MLEKMALEDIDETSSVSNYNKKPFTRLLSAIDTSDNDDVRPRLVHAVSSPNVLSPNSTKQKCVVDEPEVVEHTRSYSPFTLKWLNSDSHQLKMQHLELIRDWEMPIHDDEVKFYFYNSNLKSVSN